MTKMNEDVATKLKRYEEALQLIAGYTLPYFVIEDKEYVPLIDAESLRETAREALK